MLPSWQTGIVKQIEQATFNTRRYWIELPESPVFTFKPGQFMTLDLPIHEQRNRRWRSYSIASMPDESNVIELVIVSLNGGTGSQYIFENIHVGSAITLRGPQGIFVLPQHLDKDLYLISTGTGIAPFRSMVEYVFHHSIPHKQINLIFGTRTKADLLYADEMRECPILHTTLHCPAKSGKAAQDTSIQYMKSFAKKKRQQLSCYAAGAWWSMKQNKK